MMGMHFVGRRVTQLARAGGLLGAVMSGLQVTAGAVQPATAATEPSHGEIAVDIFSEQPLLGPGDVRQRRPLDRIMCASPVIIAVDRPPGAKTAKPLFAVELSCELHRKKGAFVYTSAEVDLSFRDDDIEILSVYPRGAGKFATPGGAGIDNRLQFLPLSELAGKVRWKHTFAMPKTQASAIHGNLNGRRAVWKADFADRSRPQTGGISLRFLALIEASEGVRQSTVVFSAGFRLPEGAPLGDAARTEPLSTTWVFPTNAQPDSGWE